MAKAIGDLTGEKFGKLTVISRAEDIPSKSGKSKSIAWLCKCDCGNEVVIRENTLRKQAHFIRSCGCSNKEENPDYKPEHLNAEDNLYWNELYDYVNNNVMGYDKNKLSNHMINRLRGLHDGKYLQNPKTKAKAYYSNKVILTTFKFCMPEINRALSKKNFYTEEIKFNYICAIVESNLNTVYMRMKSAEKVKEKIETMETNILSHNGAEYKSKNTVSDEFADFW